MTANSVSGLPFNESGFEAFKRAYEQSRNELEQLKIAMQGKRLVMAPDDEFRVALVGSGSDNATAQSWIEVHVIDSADKIISRGYLHVEASK